MRNPFYTYSTYNSSLSYKAANSVPSGPLNNRASIRGNDTQISGAGPVINVIYPIMIEQKHKSRKNSRNISLCQKEQRTISFQYTYIRFLFTTTTIKKLNQQHHHHHGKYKYAC